CHAGAWRAIPVNDLFGSRERLSSWMATKRYCRVVSPMAAVVCSGAHVLRPSNDHHASILTFFSELAIAGRDPRVVLRRHHEDALFGAGVVSRDGPSRPRGRSRSPAPGTRPRVSTGCCSRVSSPSPG